MGKSAKIARINFRKCDGVYADPVVMVADYVFGDSHGDSDVEWLFQKLDRWKNASSFTSNTYNTGGSEVEDTATSRWKPIPNSEFHEEKPAWCMHGPLKVYEASEEVIEGISVTASNKPFNGVNFEKLEDSVINSIMRRLRKGSTSSNSEQDESSKGSVRSTSTASSKA